MLDRLFTLAARLDPYAQKPCSPFGLTKSSGRRIVHPEVLARTPARLDRPNPLCGGGDGGRVRPADREALGEVHREHPGGE